MPTGYTHAVQQGEITELEPFIWSLARGMGALITMRDEPAGAPIPSRFEPDTKYHDSRLGEAAALLAALPNLTTEECCRRADDEFERSLAAYRERAERRAEYKARYEAMLAKVEAWETGADGIKAFALSQLRESLRFDCNDEYDTPPKPKAVEQWRADALAKAAEDVAYHAKERADEIQRVANRNDWLEKLRASLGSEASQ